MKTLYLFLVLLLISCSTDKTVDSNEEKEEQEIVTSVENNCKECPQSNFADQEADTAFYFSNGKKLLVCGFVEEQEGERIFSEFVVSDCDSIIDFWEAIDTYRIEYVKDTLRLLKIELLATDKSREFTKEVWITENLYYKENKLERVKQLNPRVQYTQEQIVETLKEFEQTQWLTQNTAPSEEFVEEKMLLANRLMIAAVSGSITAEEYFKDFAVKFRPDGAYAEWYDEMSDKIELTKNIKK
jgi:hypothetical protein